MRLLGAQSGKRITGGKGKKQRESEAEGNLYRQDGGQNGIYQKGLGYWGVSSEYADTGTAARFFKCFEPDEAI